MLTGYPSEDKARRAQGRTPPEFKRGVSKSGRIIDGLTISHDAHGLTHAPDIPGILKGVAKAAE
jgi:hypothetical protein